MGAEVETRIYSREQRRRYREQVQLDLEVFERLLAEGRFQGGRPVTGLEVELNLVDSAFRPAFSNAAVLEAIGNPEFQTELAQFNIELNVAPRPLPGDSALHLETDLRAMLNEAEAKAESVDSRIVMCGILPTIRAEDFEREWISEGNRYTALNDSIFVARGEDIVLDFVGPTGERLHRYADSIGPEAACTSVQLHLQVAPGDFAAHWNAAQALAGPQIALAANSPFFLGKHLGAETRIELFKQATDTRPIELKNQGVRPRVFFGERWITSIFDLFEENSQYFPVLLADLSDEDPVDLLDTGTIPDLAELRLHNGTIYRWNRPIYDVVDNHPHLRVENRVLPAGPTIVDILANAAFYYGAVRTLTAEERPVWSRMSFAAAESNFEEAARHGIDARMYWPGLGEANADELVLRHLLPLAAEGLESWGVSQAVVDRYLTIIEQRCVTGRNGATWQVDTVRRLQEQGLSRGSALTRMLELYMEHMHANEPVHTWPVP